MQSKYNTYELKVKVNGKFVDEYNEPRTNDIYIEGRKGSSYSLWFKNNTYKRVLIIPSVDGLSVLDGEPANENSPGYVVNAYDSIEIKGWTKDSNEVNEFYFSSKDRSYAERTEQSIANLGVLGILVFEEDYVYPKIYNTVRTPWPKTWLNHDNQNDWNNWEQYPLGYTTIQCSSNARGTNSTYSASLDAMPMNFASFTETLDSGNVGTGWGKEVEQKTVNVQFKKKSYPIETLTMYYDDVKGLERRGIILRSSISYKPNPFPNSKFGVKKPVK